MSENKDIDISRKALGIEEKTKERKVIGHDFTEKKKSKAQKVAETFLGGDIKDVMASIVYDVVVPTAKDLLYNIIDTGSNRLIYGNEAPARNGRRSNRREFTSYGQYYNNRQSDRQRGFRELTPHERETHEFQNFVAPDRDMADEVLTYLTELIERKGRATVGDFLHAIGKGSQATFADEKWGWRSMARAQIRQIREGWLMELPPTEEV